MRAALIITCMSLLLLGGCGQKGPLTLPQPDSLIQDR
jgi:predicted small lipoprotein YifL